MDSVTPGMYGTTAKPAVDTSSLANHSASAVIANLAMKDVEQRALASSPIQPLFWKRYVDGVISAVSANEVPSITFKFGRAVYPIPL